jgi:NAD(P)H-hydrate epimerase
MEILTGEQMRSVDRFTIEELGVESLRLMEQAGRGVAEALLSDVPHLGASGVVVLCGKGNNGGDGLVAARHLARRGVTPRTLLLARESELAPDGRTNLGAARASGLVVEEIADEAAWEAVRGSIDGGRVVLDALLGTGIRGGAQGLAACAIEHLNRTGAKVAAVDLPSGLDADSPAVPGVAVRAWRTYTLCRPKLPLALAPAAELAGTWSVVAIGIPDSAVARVAAELEWLDEEAAAWLLPVRRAESHKGTYGHLLAVAGSRGKSGAAVLLGRAALRCGAGLVTVALPGSTLPVVAAQQAELMTETLPETAAGALARRASSAALRLLGTRDALALGPGLGTSRETRACVLALVAERDRPAVVDADALNAIASGPRLARRRLGSERHPLVLTPHPGEAARLLRDTTEAVQADRLGTSRELARRTGAVVVLKGHRTLVASPEGRVAVNASGNPGMATAGTGDVLTGMVGALLARRLPAWDAARLAVFAHGAAGDRAAAELGEDGMIASDLLDRVPAALSSLAARASAAGAP